MPRRQMAVPARTPAWAARGRGRMEPQPTPPTAFVGRESELALLRAQLDEACAGRGGVVLLAGEPGIGKTRTAEHLAAHACARGARVFWGRCYEGDGAPAFWPWTQLLR